MCAAITGWAPSGPEEAETVARALRERLPSGASRTQVQAAFRAVASTLDPWAKCRAATAEFVLCSADRAFCRHAALAVVRGKSSLFTLVSAHLPSSWSGMAAFEAAADEVGGFVAQHSRGHVLWGTDANASAEDSERFAVVRDVVHRAGSELQVHSDNQSEWTLRWARPGSQQILLRPVDFVVSHPRTLLGEPTVCEAMHVRSDHRPLVVCTTPAFGPLRERLPSGVTGTGWAPSVQHAP